MHGGASPRGEGHPRYKHGKYSKYRPQSTDDVLAQIRAMAAGIDLSAIDTDATFTELAALNREPIDLQSPLAALLGDLLDTSLTELPWG